MSGEDFQSRYATVMDSMLRGAVAETTRLFQTMVDELKKEINAIKQENEELRSKCMDLEEEETPTTSTTATSTEPPAGEEPPAPCGGTSEEPPGPSEAGPADRRDTAVQCDLVGATLMGQYYNPLKSKDVQEAMEVKKQPKTHGDGQPLPEDGKAPAVYHLRVVREKEGQLKPFVKRITIELPSDTPRLSCERGTQSQASQLAIIPLPLKAKMEQQSHVIQQIPVTMAVSETAAESSTKEKTTAAPVLLPSRRSTRTPKKVKPWNSPQRPVDNKGLSQSTSVTVDQETDKSPSARADEIVPVRSSRRGRKPKEPRKSAIKRKVESIVEYLNTDEPTAEEEAVIPLVDVEEIEECSQVIPASSPGREHSSMKPNPSKSKQLPVKLDEVTPSSLNETPSVTETVETPSTESAKARSSAPPRERRISYPTLQEAMLLVEASNAHFVYEATMRNKLDVQTTSTLPETQHFPLQFTSPNQDINVPPKTTAPTVTLSTVASVRSTLKQPIPPPIITCSKLPSVTPKTIIVVPRPISSCGPQTISTLSPTDMSTVIATVVSSQKNSLPQATAGETITPPSVAAVPVKTPVATSSQLLSIAPPQNAATSRATTNSSTQFIDPRFPRVVVVPLQLSVLKLKQHNSAGYTERATTSTQKSTVNKAATTTKTDTSTANSATVTKTDSSPVNAATMTKKDTSTVNSAAASTKADTSTVSSASSKTDVFTVNSATTTKTVKSAVNSAATKTDVSTVNSATTKTVMSAVNSAATKTDVSTVNSATTSTETDKSAVNTAATTKSDISEVNSAKTSSKTDMLAVHSATSATTTDTSAVNSATLTTQTDTSAVNSIATSTKTDTSEVNSAATSTETAVNSATTKTDTSTVNSATTLTKKDKSTVNSAATKASAVNSTGAATKTDTSAVNSAATMKTNTSEVNSAATSTKTAVISATPKTNTSTVNSAATKASAVNSAATSTKTNKSPVNSATTLTKKNKSPVNSAATKASAVNLAATSTKTDTSEVNSAATSTKTAVTSATPKTDTSVNSATTLTKKDTPTVNSAATSTKTDTSEVNSAATSTKTAVTSATPKTDMSVNSATTLTKKDTPTVNSEATSTKTNKSAVNSAATSTETNTSEVNSAATSTVVNSATTKTDTPPVNSATTLTKKDKSTVNSAVTNASAVNSAATSPKNDMSTGNSATTSTNKNMSTVNSAATEPSAVNPAATSTKTDTSAVNSAATMEIDMSAVNSAIASTKACSSLKNSTSSTHVQTLVPPILPPVVQQKRYPVVRLTRLSLTALQKEMSLVLKTHPPVTESCNSENKHSTLKNAGASAPPKVPNIVQEIPEAAAGKSSQISPASQQDVDAIYLTSAQPNKVQPMVDFVPPMVTAAVHEISTEEAVKSAQPTSDSFDDDDDSPDPFYGWEDSPDSPCIQTCAPAEATSVVSEESSAIESIKQPVASTEENDLVSKTSPPTTKTSSSSKDNTSDPHLQMTKTQFLSQMAMLPIDCVKQACSNDEMDTPAVNGGGKQVDKNPLVNRLRSHRRQCKSHQLQPSHTEPNSVILPEPEPTPVPAKKARLVGEDETPTKTSAVLSPSTCPNVTSCESIPVSPERCESSKEVLTQQKASVTPSSFSPTRSSLSKIVAGLKKITSDPVHLRPKTPASTKDGREKSLNETSPAIAKRQRLIEDTVSPKKCRKTVNTASEERLPKAADIPELSKMKNAKTLDETASKERLLKAADTPELSKLKNTKTLDETASEERLPKAADAPKLSKMKKANTLDRAASVVRLPKAADTPKLSKMKKAKTLDQTAREERLPKAADSPTFSKMKKAKTLNQTASEERLPKAADSPTFSKVKKAKTLDQTENSTRSKSENEAKSSQSKNDVAFIVRREAKVVLTKPKIEAIGSPVTKSSSINPANTAAQVWTPTTPKLYQSPSLRMTKPLILSPPPPQNLLSPSPPPFHLSVSPPPFHLSPTPPPIDFSLSIPPLMPKFLSPTFSGPSSPFEFKFSPPSINVRSSISGKPVVFRAPPIISPLQPLSVLGRRLLKNQCGQCGRIFPSPAALESHVSVHKNLPPFTCVHCGKVFQDNRALNRHHKAHRDGRVHKCEQCGKGFVYKFTLTKHVQMVHGRIKPFVCQVCHKDFSTKEEVNSHIRIHTGETPYHCHLCVKKFKRKMDLNKHLRWHNGEKRYWCPYCEKGFLDSNNLKIHKYTHTGEKPRACPHCPKKFTQTGHLKKHLRTVHKHEENAQ